MNNGHEHRRQQQQKHLCSNTGCANEWVEDPKRDKRVCREWTVKEERKKYNRYWWLTAPKLNWAQAYLCTHIFDESYLYQNVCWKHTAATKPITSDDEDGSNPTTTTTTTTAMMILTTNEMIIIVGFGLIALHFILANDIYFFEISPACSFVPFVFNWLFWFFFSWVFNSCIHTLKQPTSQHRLCLLFSIGAQVQSKNDVLEAT